MAPLLIIALVVLAVASVFALLHAVAHAEEGYEDATGYHKFDPAVQSASVSTSSAKEHDHPRAPTVDTGNPWDQVNGSSCPWSFNPLKSSGHDNFPSPQT